MFHRIQTGLARTLVPLVLLPLACVLRALGRAPVRDHASYSSYNPPLPQPTSLHFVPSTRPYVLDAERRAHRTAMRLALEGVAVLPEPGPARGVTSALTGVAA